MADPLNLPNPYPPTHTHTPSNSPSPPPPPAFQEAAFNSSSDSPTAVATSIDPHPSAALSHTHTHTPMYNNAHTRYPPTDPSTNANGIQAHNRLSHSQSRSAPSRVSKDEAALSELDGGNGRPPFVLSRAEARLLAIAGIGFLLDAYDLFIINPVATMLMYRLYSTTAADGTITTHPIPANLEGFLKAGANIGSVIGQFGFGYAADALGRKAVYGKELMLIILATILCLTTPTGTLSPDSCIIYLGVFRILLGIGVGGDYPMSASITSDRSNLRKRGTMLAYIFSAQGWGSFLGSAVTLVVLKCYESAMKDGGRTSLVDGVWRIAVGISLVPAFGTLYFRLTLPESVRFKESQATAAAHAAHTGNAVNGNTGSATDSQASEEDEVERLKREQREADARLEKEGQVGAGGDVDVAVPEGAREGGDVDGNGVLGDEVEQVVKKPAHFKEFIEYFSEWRHAKVLIGTCMCWFLLDISFYGINLNQNVVLQQIGFDGSTGTPWERLFRVSTGTIIITALGFVPGYYATVLTIEVLGRKTIQIGGFLLSALFLAILAGRFHELSTVSFVVCFAFLQFFFNFGPNTTSYCYPAEVFPTRFKAFAHGISAAAGKAGAIISALAFNTLSQKVGTPVVLWIFFGVNILGAAFTLLLPEVKGRDPDVVFAEELREKRERSGRV